MRKLKRVIVPIAIVAVMLAALAGFGLHAHATRAAAAISSSCGQWTIVPSVNPGAENNNLSSIAAVSVNDVWAVGGAGNTVGGADDSTLIEHWNGTAWAHVFSPNVSNSVRDDLSSVTAISATDVWAVGSSTDSTTGTQSTLTEQWNGSSWSIVMSSNVGQFPGLNSVSADASNDVWAVGSYEDPTAKAGFTLIEHWNGTGWTIIPDPGSSLNDSQLLSVVALSPNNAWAVGDYLGNVGTLATLIEHWDGMSWSIVTSPNVSSADNTLFGVTAAGPNAVWAVGYAQASGSSQLMAITEQWNGTNWSLAPSYSNGPDSVQLHGATSVPGTQQILAVGWDTNNTNPPAFPTLNLAVRWNGTSWTRMQTASQFPTNSSTDNTLRSVVAVSASNAWAVGSYVPLPSSRADMFARAHRAGVYSGLPPFDTLILHYVAPTMGIACA